MKNIAVKHSNRAKVIAMLISIALTALSLHQFSMLLPKLIHINYDWQFELCMIFGMMLFQYPFIFGKKRQQKLDYYFNLLLVSGMGAILLFPLIILNKFYLAGVIFNLLYFFTVVLLMFFDHKRRVKNLALPAVLSFTWVLYRLLILIIII